jgi:basic membrane protein A
VDAAVYNAIKHALDGTFQGGVYSFGLREGGIGYVYDERNRPLIPDSVHQRVEALKQAIIEGRIQVPTTR